MRKLYWDDIDIDRLEFLLDGSKKVLESNWTGEYTIPSPVLYPHQWSWDSAFIAIGNSYFDTDKAISELKHLFNAQWKNGMVPHIVFNNKATTYFPAGDFYRSSQVSGDAPKDCATSALIHPPVHAIASYYIYKNARGDNNKARAIEFLKWIFPRLFRFHEYLMTRRDPEGSGLVTIFHPWESGLDNLPVWDEPLARLNIEKEKMPEFLRLDIKAVGGASETRPSNETYGRLIYLVQLMRDEYGYDVHKMSADFPFRIKDIVCSSFLYVANKHLLKIIDTLEIDGGVLERNSQVDNILFEDDDDDISSDRKKEQPFASPSYSPRHSFSTARAKSQIVDWMKKAEDNFASYFTPGKSFNQIENDDIYNYDLAKDDWIRRRTILSLLPIYTTIIPKENINGIIKWINHHHYCGAGNCFVPVLPSTDVDESYFAPKDYWRGPIWINTNWMIFYGLRDYGFYDKAEEIRQGIFKLIDKSGFREYFNPFTGEGLGGTQFSWTAALAADLVLHNSKKDEMDKEGEEAAK